MIAEKRKEIFLGVFFFVSGFCSLLYQTVWLRLAFAKFGVIPPVVSVLVSVFMFGLGLGSWLTGIYIKPLKKRLLYQAIFFYGLTECFIGLGAFIVPWLFTAGANICNNFGQCDSWIYLFSSALVMAIAILPFAFAMGSTYPLALEFLQEDKKKNLKAFGSLYLANTAGAYLGTLLTVVVLIELCGFKNTLLCASILNFTIGISSLVWGFRLRLSEEKADSTDLNSESSAENNTPGSERLNRFSLLLVLFLTGFCFMAMEVVWTRSFATVLGNMVYSFAVLLSTYLASNWFGAALYRAGLKRKRVVPVSYLLSLTSIAATLPLLISLPSLVNLIFPGLLMDSARAAVLVIVSVMPLSALLGYLTPLLIDLLSSGKASQAGKAYAVNIAGCALGPLLVGYFLLPVYGTRLALAVLILPILLLIFIDKGKTNNFALRLGASVVTLVPLCASFFFGSWEDSPLFMYGRNSGVLYRDYAGTTIACTNPVGMKKLFVNGQGMTCITPVTKFMVHLPAACLPQKPKSILVICFGMGTSLRSAVSWGSKVTAVELVPGVVKVFNYFYEDAKFFSKNPNVNIVIDDGRRYLQRSGEKYDLITIDPPPPLEASTSGLLYSKEFFRVIKNHLNPNGILQEWYGFSEQPIYLRALLRSIMSEFPHVLLYKSNYDPGSHGYHILASQSSINKLTRSEFWQKLPDEAKADLNEPIDTYPESELPGTRLILNDELDKIFRQDISVEDLLNVKEKNIEITDDHPYNEYYLLQKILNKQIFLGNN